MADYSRNFEILRTDDMYLAAALLSVVEPLKLQGGSVDTRGWVTFDLLVPEAGKEAAAQVVAAFEDGQDLDVNLRHYMKALSRVRDMKTSMTGGQRHGRRTGQGPSERVDSG